MDSRSVLDNRVEQNCVEFINVHSRTRVFYNTIRIIKGRRSRNICNILHQYNTWYQQKYYLVMCTNFTIFNVTKLCQRSIVRALAPRTQFEYTFAKHLIVVQITNGSRSSSPPVTLSLWMYKSTDDSMEALIYFWQQTTEKLCSCNLARRCTTREAIIIEWRED